MIGSGMTKQKEEFIELRHLRYFVVLAEELHFARAAERLKMEQSPLSRAIRDMERLLAVRLFERNTRSTRITRAGKVFLQYARHAEALISQARTSTRSAALGHSEHLRIGLSDCVAYCRVTEILARYRAMHPEIAVSVHEMPVAQQISALRDDLLDASISLDGDRRDGIHAEPIARNPLWAVFPSGHPHACSGVAVPAELARHPLILFSAESDLGGGSQIGDFAETLGQPHIASRANSLGTMLTLVALGQGIGLVGSAQMAAIKEGLNNAQTRAV